MYHKILFVCTGNVCRSAMAEALLKKMLADTGWKNIKVWSRGLAGSRLLPIPEIILKLMAAENIDVAGHVSSPLTTKDLTAADLILVMEKYQKEKIDIDFPSVKGKSFLLKQFVGAGDGDIEDPIGREDEAYIACKEEIKKFIEKLIHILKETNQ